MHCPVFESELCICGGGVTRGPLGVSCVRAIKTSGLRPQALTLHIEKDLV